MEISEYKVMQSGAGYYVGRSCADPECGGFHVPYDRASGYFLTKEAAEDHLNRHFKEEEEKFIVVDITVSDDVAEEVREKAISFLEMLEERDK